MLVRPEELNEIRNVWMLVELDNTDDKTGQLVYFGEEADEGFV